MRHPSFSDHMGPDQNTSDHDRPGNRRRGRHNPDDFGPGMGMGFGPGFGGPGRPRGRRRGGRGGDVRAAALLLLSEQPQHGYQLIQEIGQRSGGSWTPSPGSIYPVLQQLEDEGLLTFERVDGRKTATLTDEGTAHVEANRAELGTPWEDASAGGEGPGHREAGKALKGLVIAWRQVMQAGTADQQAAATVILDDARKSMYRILADDES